MIPRMFRCLIFIAIVDCHGGCRLAQETRGTIAGRVLDEQGGSMPGVSVTVTNRRHERLDVADDQ